jgi:ferredoxin-NADP reductase
MAAVARVPIVWRAATVREVIAETPEARTIVFDVPGWPGHVAGQHVDVRLTADDGYVAERSYSIASAPDDHRLALTVERIDDGEVSPYLTEELRPGDVIELRGPIGGFFTWKVEDGGPLLLVGGGSGVVPLMSMLRHHRGRMSEVDARLLLSARKAEAILYRGELDALERAQVSYTLTRARPDGWGGFDRRVDAAMLSAVGPAPAERPHVYVCGPTPFVEAVADLLVGLGHDPAAIRAERFGPTGS